MKVQLNIRIEEELKALAEKRAHEEQLETSEYIRKLIAEDGKTKATTSDKIKKVAESMSEDRQKAVLRLLETFA